MKRKQLIDPRNPHGWFRDAVRVVWCADDRSMVLREPFSYVDPAGREWTAAAGCVINGASVPWFFRRLFPCYIGRYRNASVVHDAYCARRTRPSAEVHEMFYHAMRCGGVGPVQAWLMWSACRVFGPSFEGSGDE